jgi:hypothetical protein
MRLHGTSFHMSEFEPGDDWSSRLGHLRLTGNSSHIELPGGIRINEDRCRRASINADVLHRKYGTKLTQHPRLIIAASDSISRSVIVPSIKYARYSNLSSGLLFMHHRHANLVRAYLALFEFEFRMWLYTVRLKFRIMAACDSYKYVH